MEFVEPKFQLKLKRLEIAGGWPWFSCDIGYTSISFHPQIEIYEEGPRVLCMDVDSDALIINDADRAGLYRVYEERSFMMQTFFQAVILDDLDFAYPKSTFQEIATLDLSDAERGIVNKHLAGFTCLYLIRDCETGLTKIGRSDDPEQRLKTLIKQDTLMPKPNNFTLLRIWDDYPYMETFLHKQFSEKRVRGEWFDLTDEDIQNLLGMCHIYD